MNRCLTTTRLAAAVLALLGLASSARATYCGAAGHCYTPMLATPAYSYCQTAAPQCAMVPQYQTVYETVYENQPYTEYQTRYRTEYRTENYTVQRAVPETTQVAQTYTVTRP